MAPAEHNPYSPGPEYRSRWATYDPEEANRMLDAIGLTDRDEQGFRLRTDGQGRLQLELATLGAQFVQHTQISEMVREHWKRIGIEAFVKEHERSLWGTRAAANEGQLFAWGNDGTDSLFIFPFWLVPLQAGHWVSSPFGAWFASSGTWGKEPPAPMRQVMELYKRGFTVPFEERVELGREIWRIHLDEVWHLGVVGAGRRRHGRPGGQQPNGEHPGPAGQPEHLQAAGPLPAADVFLQAVTGVPQDISTAPCRPARR